MGSYTVGSCSVVAWVVLVLVFGLSNFVIDIYLAWYMNPAVLVVLPADALAMFHLICSWSSTRCAEHSAVVWYTHSVLWAGKVAALQMAVLPIIPSKEALESIVANAIVPSSLPPPGSVPGAAVAATVVDQDEPTWLGTVCLSIFMLATPVCYMLLMFRASSQLFEFGGSLGHIAVDMMLHADMLWHVVLDLIDIIYMMRFARPQDIYILRNAFFRCTMDNTKVCQEQFAAFQTVGTAVIFAAILFHSQSFPGVELIRPSWSPIPKGGLKHLRKYFTRRRKTTFAGRASVRNSLVSACPEASLVAVPAAATSNESSHSALPSDFDHLRNRSVRPHAVDLLPVHADPSGTCSLTALSDAQSFDLFSFRAEIGFVSSPHRNVLDGIISPGADNNSCLPSHVSQPRGGQPLVSTGCRATRRHSLHTPTAARAEAPANFNTTTVVDDQLHGGGVIHIFDSLDVNADEDAHYESVAPDVSFVLGEHDEYLLEQQRQYADIEQIGNSHALRPGFHHFQFSSQHGGASTARYSDGSFTNGSRMLTGQARDSVRKLDRHCDKYEWPVFNLQCRRSWQVIVARKRSAIVSIFVVDMPFFLLRCYLYFITASVGMPSVDPFMVKNLFCVVLQALQLRLVLQAESETKRELGYFDNTLQHLFNNCERFTAFSRSSQRRRKDMVSMRHQMAAMHRPPTSALSEAMAGVFLPTDEGANVRAKWWNSLTTWWFSNDNLRDEKRNHRARNRRFVRAQTTDDHRNPQPRTSSSSLRRPSSKAAKARRHMHHRHSTACLASLKSTLATHVMLICVGFAAGFVITRHSWPSANAYAAVQMEGLPTFDRH